MTNQQLTQEELDLIVDFDYQALNNGMDGWYGNGYYAKIFDFIKILEKRNTDLDREVIEIFQKVLIAQIQIDRNEGVSFLPEIQKYIQERNEIVEDCSNKYSEIAKEFMNSYGLKDRMTKFAEAWNLRNQE